MIESIYITGLAGVGKSTLGRHLAGALEAPVAEVGVIIRLLALLERPSTERRAAATLWRWTRGGRLDFHGASEFSLAAAVPRLDGRSIDRQLWLMNEPERLATLSGTPSIQDVVHELLADSGYFGGGIVIGRCAPGVTGHRAREIRLIADRGVRTRRKRLQVADLGLPPEYAVCDPAPSAVTSIAETDLSMIDTTSLTVREVTHAALRSIKPERSLRLARAARAM